MAKRGLSEIAQLRVALAQINPTVGAISANSELIVQQAKLAVKESAHIALFPEMTITGYPVEDLALRSTFRAASRSAVASLARVLQEELCGELVVVVGYLDESADGKPQNAVAVIHRGAIVAKYVKHHLPNYGVFDEFRNFVPGDQSLVVRIHGVDVGIAICEDIWRSEGPVSDLAERNVGLVLVPNGSPFERSKGDARSSLVSQRAARAKCARFGWSLTCMNRSALRSWRLHKTSRSTLK